MEAQRTIARVVATVLLALGLCPLLVRAAGEVAVSNSKSSATRPADVSQPTSSVDDVAAATSAVVEATRQLASGNFAERQAAHVALQKALAQQLAAILMITDSEAAARGRGVVRFESTTAAWALGVFGTLGREDARQAISFACSPEVSALMVDVTGDDLQLQHDALAKIVKTKDPRVPAFLAAIINNPDQNRACVAIDLAWRVAPSEPLLSALWNCASRGMFVPDFRGGSTRSTFLGDHVEFQISTPYRMADSSSEFAADLLAHWKDPRTGAAFARFVKSAARMASETDPQSHFELRLKQRPFVELAEAFGSREAVTFAATAAAREQAWKVGGVGVGSKVTTNRTQMIGLLAVLNHQDPAGFLLTNSGFGVGQVNWTAANLVDEEQSAKKARAWWEEHKKEYPELAGGQAATASGEATQGRPIQK